MLGELSYSDKSILSPLSAYQPSEGVKTLTQSVKKAYQDGQTIQNTPYAQFNNVSLIERINEDQKAWLSWTPEPYEGEDDWRWNGVRPITRNKVISVSAHLTAQLLVPQVFAQNDADEEDRSAANVMRDLIEYNIRHSNYETAILFGVISSLVNPVAYFKVDYVRSWQELWKEDKREKVLDDVFSGFQHSLVSPENLLISNPYQYELQKQDWIIEKDYVSQGEAEAEYGEHENFKYVQAGKKVILHDDNLFYDIEDPNSNLVEKAVYKCRRKDIECTFLGGVYLGGDNPDFNPIVHRNNKNKPKYNLVKFGYEPIDSMSFYFYKSLVAKMANDQEATDREWQMYFDSAFLSTFPPTISMGAGKIDRSVIAPATNTEIGQDAKIQPLQVANPGVALQALREAERSITETSQDPQLAGIQEGSQKTARESILLQQNAQTNLGIAAKMIGVMVKEIGGLVVDDVIRYQTIGEVSEITNEMTYKTFLLDGKVREGKTKTSHIRFTDRFAGKKMTEKQKDMEEYKLMEEGDDKEVFEVNPYPFSRMNYLITIDAERALQRNDAFERAFKLETYDRAVADSLIQQDPEAHQKILRDFLFEPLMRGEASNYLPKLSQAIAPLVPPAKGLPSRITRSAAMEQLQTV